MPIVVGQGGDILFFVSRVKPGAKVPEHAHKQAIFRVVIDGSLKYGSKTLKAADWMLVPAGQVYSIQAGPEGCTIFYAHIPWPWPWPPK
jgi:quercetin dioxygenase-like cupin family protein